MPHDARRLLLDFLAGRNAPCPSCAYNLRDLTTPTCPECGQALLLRIGREPPRFALLIAALAPCMFSGIAGLFLAVPVVGATLLGSGVPWGFVILDAFGLASGVTGIVLSIRRERFIRQRRAAQVVWVVTLWCIHAFALAVLISVIALI